jgi:hypothetical protein
VAGALPSVLDRTRALIRSWMEPGGTPAKGDAGG